MIKALSEINAKYIGRAIDPLTGIQRTYPVTIEYVQTHHLMMLWTKRGFLDLFDYIPGFPDADVRQIYDSSMHLEGLRYASINWLRQMKQVAGRTKDLDDLKNLPEG